MTYNSLEAWIWFHVFSLPEFNRPIRWCSDDHIESIIVYFGVYYFSYLSLVAVRRIYFLHIGKLSITKNTFLLDIFWFIREKFSVGEPKKQDLFFLRIFISSHEHILTALLVSFPSDLNFRMIKLSLKNKIYHLFNI